MNPKTPGRALALITCCIAALTLAACGSSSDSGSSSTASPTSTGAQASSSTYAAAVEAARKPITDTTLGAPVPAQRGKKVTAIMCTAQSEGCALVGKSFKTAAAALGWQATIVDGGGSPDKQSTAMLNAIAGGTDGIFLISIDREAVSQGLAKAHAQHIPVVSTASNNVAGTGPENVYAEVGFDGRKLGAAAANWIVADSGGKAKIVVLKSPELKALTDRWAGAEPVLKSCAGCKIEATTNYSLATAVNDLPLRIKSVLLAHPDADYVYLDGGGFAAPVASAVQEVGRGQVKLATLDCVSTNLAAIRKGAVVASCAGLGLVKAGWSAADQLNRAFAGKPPSKVGDTGEVRLFDKTNLPSTEVWSGDFDYESNYKKNWGL